MGKEEEPKKNKQRGFFMVDNEYMDNYAKVCGYKATLVYMCVRRCFNRKLGCFPSIAYMVRQLKIGRDSIMAGIKMLEEWNIIKVDRNRRNNSYFPVDKSKWKPIISQVADNDLKNEVGNIDTNSRQERLKQVDEDDTNNTNKEKYKSKKTYSCNASVAGDGVNKIFEIFSKINPTLNYANKTQRDAAKYLLEKFGLKNTISMSEQIISIQGKQYAPVATNPYQMKEKLAQFKLYFDRQKNKPKIAIIS